MKGVDVPQPFVSEFQGPVRPVAANLRYHQAWTRIVSGRLRDLADAECGLPIVVPLVAGELCVVQAAIPEAFASGTDYRTVIRGSNPPGRSTPVVPRRADPAPAA